MPNSDLFFDLNSVVEYAENFWYYGIIRGDLMTVLWGIMTGGYLLSTLLFGVILLESSAPLVSKAINYP